MTRRHSASIELKNNVVYENWQLERWETPVSDADSLAMVSLVDDGELSITVQDLRDPESRRLRFVFSAYPAYRNILEQYRTELWEKISEAHEKLGWTLIVANSRWVATLRERARVALGPAHVGSDR